MLLNIIQLGKCIRLTRVGVLKSHAEFADKSEKLLFYLFLSNKRSS